MNTAKSKARNPAAQASRKKVTYSIPADVVGALHRLSRRAGARLSASGIVADALRAYLSAKEREELEAQFDAAAVDPLFQADNASIAADFAVLDAEAEVARKRR